MAETDMAVSKAERLYTPQEFKELSCWVELRNWVDPNADAVAKDIIAALEQASERLRATRHDCQHCKCHPDRVCADELCGKSFAPTHGKQKFCCKDHARRAIWRRFVTRNPNRVRDYRQEYARRKARVNA